MREELKDRLPLQTRIRVKEVAMSGFIYERGVASNGDTIYGVKLDRIAWAGGMTTEVWHCIREKLEAIKEKTCRLTR